MTLLVFLVILSILVMVHELGHYWTAKKNGILVEEFGFGLPPRIWSKKVGETTYSINLLPIGGFVKLFGEDQIESSSTGKTSGTSGKNLKRAFFAQKKSVRALVLTAGVIMNFVLGVVLFSIIYTRLGIPTETDMVKVVEVMANTPAADAGMGVDEVVIAVDGEMVESTNEFVALMSERAGEEVELTLGKVDSETYGRMVTVVPRVDPPEGEGALGVVVSATQMKRFAFWQMPFRGAWFGLKEAIGWGVAIIVGLGAMLGELFSSGVVPTDVAGPVGIFQLTGDVARAGILPLMQFVAILSINLAVLNILPFPALDGGRLLFLVAEAVTGRRPGAKVEQWTHGLGMALLLLLMVLVTLNDIVRITESGTILGLVKKVIPF